MGIKKSAKGEISIENFRGRIRLRWRRNGERYALILPFLYTLEGIKTQPTLDNLVGAFTEWPTHIKNVDIDSNIHYFYVRNLPGEVGKPAHRPSGRITV
jgi:hypothetical protein